jgi:hypothetical protein
MTPVTTAAAVTPPRSGEIRCWRPSSPCFPLPLAGVGRAWLGVGWVWLCVCEGGGLTEEEGGARGGSKGSAVVGRTISRASSTRPITSALLCGRITTYTECARVCVCVCVEGEERRERGKGK